MGKVEDIISGWSNYFQGSKSGTLDQAKTRAAICVECEHIKYGAHAAILPDTQLGEIQGYYCGECLCPISTAVRSSGYKCPLNKW